MDAKQELSASRFSRRAFSVSLLGAPFLLKAKPNSSKARIKLDPDRVIGAIDPKIYGNFTEHLGRCIEGGIFQEGSPLSDANGFRQDVLKAVKGLNVTFLRWPGGNFASNYHWTDGIGPRDKRPARLEMAWGTIEDNRFGTHEFLDYTALLGTEPYFCANMGTGTWVEAQQWVEYCNVPEGTAMTKLRQQNGRKDPWHVRYWGLGNEMDGPWQMGHKTAEDYGKFALEAAKLMKWTDPSIKLVATGSSNFGPGADWIRLEPHCPRTSEKPRRLSFSSSICREPEERLLRIRREFTRSRGQDQDGRGYHPLVTFRDGCQQKDLYCLG